MLLLLIPLALAADDGSSLTFAPWTGAGLTFSETGSGLGASLSGALGKGAVISANIATPFNLSNAMGTGTSTVDVSVLASTTVQRIRDGVTADLACRAGASEEACMLFSATATPDQVAAQIAGTAKAMADACIAAGIVGTCDSGTMDRFLMDHVNDPVDADGKNAKLESVLDALKVTESTRAELVTGYLATPMDELASGTVKHADFEIGFHAKGAMDRFSAYGDTTSAAPTPYANGTVEGGIEIQWVCPFKKTRGGWGGSLSALGDIASTYGVDATNPDRVLATSAPVTTGGFSAEAALYSAWGKTFNIPGAAGDASTGYFPVVGLTGKATYAAANIAVDSSLTAALRPTGAGPGLSVGVQGSYATYPDGSSGVSLIPIATISGEIPNLAASKNVPRS